MVDARQRGYIEWQTKSLASFLSGLAQSEKGAKAMAAAVGDLNLLGGKKRQRNAPPTKSHLPPEDGPPSQQSSAPKQAANDELRSGGFEKLSAMFGSAGARFTLPPSAQ